MSRGADGKRRQQKGDWRQREASCMPRSHPQRGQRQLQDTPDPPSGTQVLEPFKNSLNGIENKLVVAIGGMGETGEGAHLL